MSYRVTLNGKKADARKALEEQSDANIKAQNQTADQKASILKLLDALPEGNLSGTIEDHNNGTVTMNVTVKNDYMGDTAAATVKSKGMPGAGAQGRPDLTPSGQQQGQQGQGQQTAKQ